ncbi:MAG: PucR family transcriptional regulator [Butyrivibrio sp.]
MLNIALLQQFDYFSNFTLCAGEGGLYRVVSNVVVLDYEGIEENFCDFHEGDFVLTSLLYAKENPDKIYSSFSRLMDIGVSAIAIKSVLYNTLPREVIELANEKEVPLFFFHSIYIEDVILNINESIRSNTNYDYSEALINSFFEKESNSDRIDELLKYIQKDKSLYASTMYISYRRTIDNFSIQRYLNKIQLKKDNMTRSFDIHFTKYKKGILFMYFYREKTDSRTVEQNWLNLRRDLDITDSGFYIGLNNSLLPLSKIDIAIERSLYANHICQSENASIIKYDDLKIYNLLLAASDNAYIHEYLKDIMTLIEGGNPARNKYLPETLYTYVQCNFNIEETGRLLFQHPNTIRYRIGKLKSILNINNEFEFQLIAMLLVNTYKKY